LEETQKQKVQQDDRKEALKCSKRFCTRVWMKFLFTATTTVNGKVYRIWTLLRTEIQNMLLTALMTAFSAESLKVSGGPDKEHEGGDKEYGAFQLAEMLCSTFRDKPVTEIADDGSEET
jgi:hypothetical protein